MEMKHCPEQLKKDLAMIRAGKSHPREHLLHLNDYVNHISAVMQSLNNERSDGKILRGETPLSAFTNAVSEPAIKARAIPDSAKWLYRSAYSVKQVTRNGFRVTLGTGRNQLAYTYDNPEVLGKWRGHRVIGFWNQHDPDTDAVIYTVRNGRAHQFLCVAKRVTNPDRLGASEQAWSAEATRKKLHHNLAVTQSRDLSPYLVRSHVPGPRAVPGSQQTPIQQRLDAARQAREASKKQTLNTRAQVNRAELTPEDVQAATTNEPQTTNDDLTPDEIAELFSPGTDRLADQACVNSNHDGSEPGAPGESLDPF